jgi:hypothetical protein
MISISDFQGGKVKMSAGKNGTLLLFYRKSIALDQQ